MTTYTPTQIAARPAFATDAKTLRIFLRADAKAQGYEAPGKGSKWAIEGRDINSLRGRFNAWSRAQAEAKAKRAEANQAAQEAAEAEEAADEAEEMAAELEPTEADLEALTEAEDEG